MDFKKLFSKKILIPSSFVILLIGVILWRYLSMADSTTPESIETSPPTQEGPTKQITEEQTTHNSPSEGVITRESELDISKKEDAAIQEQLDRDREEQRQTKYLKIKLEQTSLELEQEKALAEINKLKMENRGTFKESIFDGQNNLPEIKVEYIGGDSVKKEAILSIAGANYQVKEKSSPTNNIQVVSISDYSVTLHFSAPQELTKTIDYKPE